MTSFSQSVQHILDRDGAISRRHHPHLIGSVDHLVATGRLVAVLPGTYVPAAAASSPLTRMRALAQWDPDAILTGAAAAMLTYWPEVRLGAITCSVRHHRQPRAGYVFTRRSIPPTLVIDHRGLRFTAPALTALELCDVLGGEAIDRALRTRAVSLAQIEEAMDLMPARPGNRQRRALVLDSRDEPWSAAERCLHRLLRTAAITGWRANGPIRVRGRTYLADVRFAREKIALEVDGREYHENASAFELDRWRQNLLTLDGWLVLRFTWTMLQERPADVVAQIRDALRIRSSPSRAAAA